MKWYVYKITNLFDNKIYVGYSHSNDPVSHKYLGSGTLIRNAIRKYGAQYFKKEILYIFDTQAEALLEESRIVNVEFIKRSDVYNLVVGGHGGPRNAQIDRCSHNKNKIGIKNLLTNKNKYIKKEELNEYLLTNKWILGGNNKGTAPVWDIKLNKFIYVHKEDLDLYLNCKTLYFCKHTTSNKKCMTDLNTNKLKYVDHDDIEAYKQKGYILHNLKSGVNKNTIYIHHTATLKNKRITPEALDEYLKIGYSAGRIQKQYNKIFIKNASGSEKTIFTYELEYYLANNWLKGRISRTINTKWMHNNHETKRIPLDQVETYKLNGWSLGILRL